MAAILLAQQRRREYRNLYVERAMVDPGDVLRFDDRVLISRYRLPRHVIIQLAEHLRPKLERPTRRHGALPVILQLTNALRFFAKGDFQSEVADLAKVSQPAVSKNLEEVATAIGGLAVHYIRFPTGQEVNVIKEAFYRQSNMPGVLGLVDGSLFPIKAPAVDEGAYVCRKPYHAINVQAVGDHNMMIRHLVARWPGSAHDAFVFNTRWHTFLVITLHYTNFNMPISTVSSYIATNLVLLYYCSDLNTYLGERNVSGWLLGDSGYPLKAYLMTPVVDEQTDADMR